MKEIYIERNCFNRALNIINHLFSVLFVQRNCTVKSGCISGIETRSIVERNENANCTFLTFIRCNDWRCVNRRFANWQTKVPWYSSSAAPKRKLFWSTSKMFCFSSCPMSITVILILRLIYRIIVFSDRNIHRNWLNTQVTLCFAQAIGFSCLVVAKCNFFIDPCKNRWFSKDSIVVKFPNKQWRMFEETLA